MTKRCESLWTSVRQRRITHVNICRTTAVTCGSTRCIIGVVCDGFCEHVCPRRQHAWLLALFRGACIVLVGLDCGSATADTRTAVCALQRRQVTGDCLQRYMHATLQKARAYTRHFKKHNGTYTRHFKMR